MTHPTTLNGNQRMANAILEHQGTTLRDLLSELHGAGMSYEQIAKRLHSETDGVVSLSYQTVKRWLDDLKVSA
jgi:transposase